MHLRSYRWAIVDSELKSIFSADFVVTMPPVQLSKADSKVLAQVFDPESISIRPEVIVDADLPSDRHILDEAIVAQLKHRERNAIQIVEAFETLEHKTIVLKHKTFSRALSLLDAIVAEYPKYASARNNRAQLRRWRFGDRNMLFQQNGAIDPERVAAVSAIEADLRESISLASPQRVQDAVSPSQGRLLGQAYTQLAAILHGASEDLAAEDINTALSNEHRSRKEHFEEEASRNFYLGGLYGNEVAQALAVNTNPHAKLCGGIVQEAMRKEMAQVL
nr:tetratricopeptide repeat protein 36 [Quercus suber]